MLNEEYVLDTESSNSVPSDEDQKEISQMLADRILARKKNRYDLADKIRDELKKKYNVEIDDRKKEYVYHERAPSFLEQTELKENTPGHALNALQKHAAKGSGHFIRQSDFITLCNYARPGHLSDAKVIATALREFKCNNRFVLQLEGSEAAVNGMLRAMKPTWKVQDGRPDVRAALFILEQILDGENSGLFYTIERDQVDNLFDLLHNGLLEMQQNGFKVKIEEKEEEEGEGEANSENEVAESSEEEKMSKDALRLTEGVFKLLIKRRSRPEWDMKKRAKRKYLKRLQVGGGPSQHTLCLATQISILVSGSVVAQEKIVEPFGEAKKTASVDEATLKLLESAKAEEQAAEEEARAAEAAAAAAVEDAEEGEEDDGDGDEDETKESADEDGESVKEDGEEKKD